MRNIKKVMKVELVQILVYNRDTKKEEVLNVEVAEVQKAPEIPSNYIVIEKKVVDVKEVTYKMSPETFVKYAEIEAPKAPDIPVNGDK